MPPVSPTEISRSQVEAIVRGVLDRLLAEAATATWPAPAAATATGQPAAASGQAATHEAATSEAAAHQPPAAAGTLRLEVPLLSLEDLRGRWTGLRVLEVPSRCVITPAAHDALRQHAVALQRTSASSTAKSHTPPPAPTHVAPAASADSAGVIQSAVHPPAALLVLAPPRSKTHWPATLQSLPVEFRSASDDAQQTATAVQQHLATPGGRCVWSTAQPFAAHHATRGLAGVVAAHLSRLDDLPAAVHEIQPNLIIVDDQRWSTHALAQLVRGWHNAAQRRSPQP